MLRVIHKPDFWFVFTPALSDIFYAYLTQMRRDLTFLWFHLGIISESRETWVRQFLPAYHWYPAIVMLAVAAASGLGIGNLVSTQVTLSAPNIKIVVDPISGDVIWPTASQAFAAFDADNNGIVNEAQGSGGAFLLFISGGVLQPGNRFDRISGGVRANIIVEYFFTLNNQVAFVAFHFFMDPASGQVTPVRALHGDPQNGKIWIGTPTNFEVNVVEQGNPNLMIRLMHKGAVALDVVTA